MILILILYFTNNYYFAVTTRLESGLKGTMILPMPVINTEMRPREAINQRNLYHDLYKENLLNIFYFAILKTWRMTSSTVLLFNNVLTALSSITTVKRSLEFSLNLSKYS